MVGFEEIYEVRLRCQRKRRRDVEPTMDDQGRPGKEDARDFVRMRLKLISSHDTIKDQAGVR